MCVCVYSYHSHSPPYHLVSLLWNFLISLIQSITLTLSLLGEGRGGERAVGLLEYTLSDDDEEMMKIGEQALCFVTFQGCAHPGRSDLGDLETCFHFGVVP